MGKLDALKYAQGLSKYLDTIGVGDTALVRGVKDLARRALEQWFSTKGLLIAPVHGFRLSVPQGRYLYLYRSYEPYTSELFMRATRTAANVLDIGACFGYYSLLAARALERGGVVYAFEPAPENFAVLVRNIALNDCVGKIIPICKAVGDRSRTHPLHLSRFAENNSLSSSPLFATTETIDVDAITVDEVVQDQRVSVIKMDIEGFEPRALEGMRRTLQRNRDVVLFTEFNVKSLRGLNIAPELFVEQLEEFGFHVRLIDENMRQLLPLSAATIARAELEPALYSNLLCTRDG